MLNKILSFLIVVGIPGVITIVVNSALGWNFGIMGAIWLFAMIFLCLNSIKGKKMESRPLGRTRNGACGFSDI